MDQENLIPEKPTDDTGSEDSKDSALDNEYEAEIRELKAKIQELTEFINRSQPQAAQQQITPDQLEEYNRKFIENPVEVMAKVMEKYQKDAVERATRQAEEKLALERFWNRFENKYPNLYAEKWAVDKVIEDDFNIVRSLGSEEKIMDYLAKKAAEKIQGAYKSLSKSKPSAAPEGYSPFTWPAAKETEESDTGDGSLTSILREKKLKRMKSSGIL